MWDGVNLVVHEARAHRQIIHSRHSCSSLPSPCAPLMPMVSDTFEATHTRSLVIILAHTIMFQVLTGMCSSRAHRLWSIHFKSSNAHGRALRDTAAHRDRATCAARRVGSSEERENRPRSPTPSCCRGACCCPRRSLGLFSTCSWLVSVNSGNQRLMLDAASAGAVGGTIGGAVRAREGLV